MTRDIIQKLKEQIEAGITTEVQVVYLLTGVRKLIERDEVEDEYPKLKFHCDWVLHPRRFAEIAEGVRGPTIELVSRAFFGCSEAGLVGATCPAGIPVASPAGDGCGIGKSATSGWRLGEPCWERVHGACFGANYHPPPLNGKER